MEVATRSGQRSRGRPALLYEYDPDRFCVVSLYIGLRYAEISLCDGIGRSIVDNVELTPGWDPDRVLAESGERIEQLIGAAGIEHRPRHVGVVVHGLVDEQAGTASSEGMGWQEVPIVSLLERRVDASVAIIEASRAAAIAESREGAARGCGRATVFNLGPEITATQVIDGVLDTGTSGLAGMVGRCRVASSQGALSIDQLVGSFAAKRRYNELAGDDVEWMSDVYALARAGDPHAMAVVSMQVDAMSFAAAWLIAVGDPECLVITGVVSDYSESAKAQLQAGIVEQADERMLDHCSIRLSTLGRQAWIRGGVYAALDNQRNLERSPATDRPA
jgi:glucokinase